MASLFLVVACEKVEATEEAASELPELRVQTYDTDFSNATLSDVRVSLKEGALSFETVDNYRQAKRAILNSTPEQIDAWAASLGFSSWARNEREIQARLEANPRADINTLLSESEGSRFIIEDDGLVSLAYSGLMAEMISLSGVLFIQEDLNYFGRDQHILIPKGTLSDLQRLIRGENLDNESIEITNILSDIGDENARESKFFTACPYTYIEDLTLPTFGHRKQEKISRNNQQRMTYTLETSILTISNNGIVRTLEFEMNTTLRNERRQTTWFGTQPQVEVGSLQRVDNEPHPSGGVSVDETDVWRPLNINRFLSFSSVPGQFVLVENFTGSPSGATNGRLPRIVPNPATSFINQLIDNAVYAVPSQAFFDARYRFNSGQISANWLERSETMDIQLGCPN